MDTGDGVSHIVPIYESLALHHAILRAEYPMKNPTDQGYSLTTAAEKEFARDVKEKLCYIASDYDTVPTSTPENDKEKTCDSQTETPSPSALNVSVTRKCCSSQISPFVACGSHDTFFLCFMKCDVTTRKGWYTSVVSSVGPVARVRIHMSSHMSAFSTLYFRDCLEPAVF